MNFFLILNDSSKSDAITLGFLSDCPNSQKSIVLQTYSDCLRVNVKFTK